MGVYKVLQDIEAEDKFLGPLTLRQFIYGAITAVAVYISFLGLSKGTWIIAAVMSPIILFGGFLAWPWSKDQPTEVWLLAKIRFFLKPRKRIWDQSGVKQLVTITVPKRVEQHLTNGLSQNEVQSRLKALAQTIDSRGWAVKNVQVNLTTPTTYQTTEESDRLIDPTTLPQAVPTIDVSAADDILDERNNPTAQHLNALISEATTAQKQHAVQQMQQAKQPDPTATVPGKWFVPEPTSGAAATTPSTDEQQALLKKIHADQAKPDPTKYHVKTTAAKQSKPPAVKPQAVSTPTPDPAILNLARNDDLNVATIARQAAQPDQQSPGDEVVISLR